MESVDEKAGTTSLTAQLRQHDSLSLASDLRLLKCMQDLSLQITSQTNNICHDLETLEKDTTVACIQVENCIQSLNLISTKQFMEKRVYDEEVAELKGENLPEPPSSSTAVDFVPKIKEALIHGLPIVRDRNSGELQSSSHNAYTSRFLPHILGSEVFIDSPYVGVAKRKVESKKQGILANQEFSNAKVLQEASRSVTPPSPTLVKSKNQSLDEEILSDSDVSSVSSKVFPSVEPRKSIIEQQPHQPGLNFFKDELAARLKIPSAISQTLPSAEQSKVEPQVNRISHPQPAPRTVIYPPKRKTLFDESSSESDEDLFKPIPPKTPTPTPTVLDQSTPPRDSPPKTLISVPNAPILPPLNNVNGSAPTVKGGLFSSSDSEDDLFAGVTSSATNSAIKRKPAPILLDDEDEDIFSTKTVIPASSQFNAVTKSAPQVTSTSLFDDDKNEDDFFPKVKTTQQITQPTITASNGEKVPPSSLFGDKKDQEKPPIKPALETAPKLDPSAVTQSTVASPKPSIFTDSESDDEDLFRKIVAKPKRVSVAEPSKYQSASPPEISSNKNPNLFQSTPLKNPIENSSIVTFLQDSNQEKSIPTAAVQSSRKPNKAQTSLLFSDDSDDEDLFSVVKPQGPSPSIKSDERSHVHQDEKKPQVKSVQSIFLPPGNKGAHKVDGNDEKIVPISSYINKVATEDLTERGISTLPIVEIDSSERADITDKVVDNVIEKIKSPEGDSAIPTKETSASSSLIASLKLSLSKQPNSLPFLTTPSPVDGDGNSVGPRKPFGGVSVFGSTTATSPVEQTESVIVTIPSQAQPEHHPGDSLKNNDDSLPCLGRMRPKGPATRKPPSRNFRRSVVCEVNDGDNNFDAVDAASWVSSDNVTKETNKLLNDELRVSSPEVPETNEKLNPTTSNNQSEVTKTAVDSNKLFGESDSSDDELFKPLPVTKRLEAATSREPVSGESLLPRKPGGLISNVKINSSILSSSGGGQGSDSDDGLFGAAQAITPVSRSSQNPVTSLLADSDDDDDLFASVTKHRPKAASVAASSVGGSEIKAPPPTDPLLRFLE